MFPVAGCNPVDTLSRVAVKWFDSIILHQVYSAMTEWPMYRIANPQSRGFESHSHFQLYSGRLVARTPAFQVGEAGSKPVRSTKYAVVALWEGDSLSARLRWVRFPSTAPILLSESKHGVGASLLTKNELGSIPSRTAKQLGEVVGYGMGLHPV